MGKLLLLSVISYCLIIFDLAYGSYQCDKDDESFNSVIENLQKNGDYIVEKGYLEWKLNKTSYGANPTLIYGIYWFERIEFNETLKDYKISKINISIRTHQEINNFWFMYGSTAILSYLCLPPSKYYSYRSYVNRRLNPKNTTNYTGYLPEEDPYGSLGDMINHEVVNKTLDNLNDAQQKAIIISTGDMVTYNDIYDQLTAQSNSNNNFKDIINLDSIPQQWVKYKEKDWEEQILRGNAIDSLGMSIECNVYTVTANTF